MAEKKVERKVTREGKVYQLKKSASRAAREDGLKDSEFKLMESARGDGWYYIKNSVADSVMADLTEDDIKEYEKDIGEPMVAVELKGGDVLTSPIGHLELADNPKDDKFIPNPEVQDKLTKVVMSPDFGVSPTRDSEMVRTVVENAAVTIPAGKKVVDLTDREVQAVVEKRAVLVDDPPPLPSEQATKKEKKVVSPSIPKLNKSTIPSPTKMVWSIAEEMHNSNPNVRRTDVIAECVKRGIAFFTARTQYQQWRAAKIESDKNAAAANSKVK